MVEPPVPDPDPSLVPFHIYQILEIHKVNNSVPEQRSTGNQTVAGMGRGWGNTGDLQGPL